MFQAHSTTLDLLLEPGDYRPWGVLRFDNQPGHEDDRPRTMRYYNPQDHAVHPVKRRNAARVDSLQFAKEGTRNWFVQGLTIRNPSANPGVNEHASNLTVDFCLIEDFGEYGFRMRNTDNCTVQRCVIRDSRQFEVGESTGVQVRGNRADHILGIQILDNEIYNVGDGIQITANDPDPWIPIEVLIEGNDVYLERSRYICDTNTSLDENAIDIKAGSDTPASTVIRNNRMWGMRRNAEPASAFGELLVLQQYSRKVVIEGNIMGDAPRGMKDEGWPDEAGIPADSARDILIRDNEFYAIRDYAAADEGAVTKPITGGFEFLDNHVARSSFLADVGPLAYGQPDPKYLGNVLADVDGVQRQPDPAPPSPGPAALPFDPALNPSVPPIFGYETYERRRWTGREFALGAIPRPIPWWYRLRHPRDTVLGSSGP